MKRAIVVCLCLGLFLIMSPQFSISQDAKSTAKIIQLPAPQTDGGKPLMQALKERKSTRGGFGPEQKLSMQTLSNLLWAADGVNRPEGHRTAPSAVDWQNIDIYAATADGVFLYDAAKNALKVVLEQDVRATCGLDGAAGSSMKQDFAKTAPVSLVYVANLAKTKAMNYGGENVGLWWSAVGVGAIAQNVYLYCASENLACILRAMVDAAKITEVFKLGPDQKVMLTSTIAQFKK
jgi:SagB-type dehydrogenase family enzyme